MKRIERLVDVKQRAALAAEAALATALASTAAAEQLLLATEKSWATALDAAAHAATTGDLADLDARSRSLHMAVQRAEALLAARRRDEQGLRDEVTAARTELRRFEMWSDRVTAAAVAEADRMARIVEDDLAARTKKDS